MEKKSDVSNSFGTVLLEVGKYIDGRQCTQMATLQDSIGRKAHIWELADGETVTVMQDLNAERVVVRHAEVISSGKSSWQSFVGRKCSITEAVEEAIRKGFSLRESRNPYKSAPSQLSLMDCRLETRG